MNLTRFGFNCLVVVFLAPLLLTDIWGNTTAIGVQSDIFYYKSMLDGLLLAYALYALFTDKGTATAARAAQRRADQSDPVVSFSQLSAFEYVYCGFLCVYAGANWWSLHELNKASTGIVSIITLVWSFVSIAVAILAAVQFWRIKSGAIVQLTHKVVQ